MSMKVGSVARRLWRGRKGAVYIEFAAAVLILSMIFIGSAIIGAKTIDYDRDARAARGAADMTWVLDRDTTSPAQSDFDTIGQKVLEATNASPDEAFQMYFTLVEYDHTGSGLKIDWQGSYGTDPTLNSRVSVGGAFATVNGYDLTVQDDEKLIIVEIYRTRRGLFVDTGAPVYSFALSYKFDPVHA